jgi:hypothetical protein
LDFYAVIIEQDLADNLQSVIDEVIGEAEKITLDEARMDEAAKSFKS